MNEYLLTANPPKQEHPIDYSVEPSPTTQPLHTPLASTISTSYRTRESKSNILIKDKGSVRNLASLSCIQPLPVQILNSPNSYSHAVFNSQTLMGQTA